MFFARAVSTTELVELVCVCPLVQKYRVEKIKVVMNFMVSCYGYQRPGLYDVLIFEILSPGAEAE